MKKRFLLKGFFAVSAASVCMSIDGLKNATNMATAAVDLDQTTATIQQDPAITILTHALGGNPSFWSNDFNIDSNGDYHDITGFCYDPNSLIEKIHNYFGSDFALYLVEHKDKDTEMEIKHCIFDYGTNDYTYETVEKIENFPRHTVVVPNLTTDYSLEELDGCFTNIINKLQNDYYEDKGCHTRINFIGHSMGGLINMQYVIQHPEFAASLISLGTPYNGTTYNNDFVKNVCGIDAFNQQCICGDCDHSWFFCDLERRREAWNEMYANNHQIKFLTCSGETSVDLIEKLVNNQEVAKYHSGISWAQTVASFVYPASVVLSGDFSVDFDSQGAPGFDGAIRFNKKFDANNSRIDKRCLNDMGVPHALEPYDEDMHKVILRTLGYQDPTKRSNSAHGINIELIGLSQQEMNAFYPDEHIVKITNNTGKARSLAYNKKLCFEGDAEEWSGLGDVELTDVLQNGESTLVSIQDNYAGDTITVSYAENNYRYIVYCSDLKLNDSYLHFKRGNEKIPNMTYTSSSGIGINIVSKYFTTPFATWYFEITNNTNKTRTFYYNDALCFKDDGLSWNNLSDIEEVVLKPKENTITLMDNYGRDAMAEVEIRILPEILKDKKLSESIIRTEYNLTVLMLKRNDRALRVTKDTIIEENDIVVIFGNYNSIKKIFLELNN